MYYCRMYLRYVFLSALSLLFAILPFLSWAQSVSIEGSYQGKNVYVQNPLVADGFGYCATKVTVNGEIMPGGITESTFEVNFANFNIALNDPVFIVIEHNEGCKPKFINPEVLLPKSTYTLLSMHIDPSGKMRWKTRGEDGKLPFVIEQFRWDKWVVVGEVLGEGTAGENSYSFQLTPHSGLNKVRVVQVDHSGLKRPSKATSFRSTIPKVIKSPTKVKDIINFTANGKPIETRYEIFDAYGNLVKKGFGSSVNCSRLLSGAYYINFDNVNEKFLKN